MISINIREKRFRRVLRKTKGGEIMKIALTGGSGRVGEYLIDELKKYNYEVVVLDQKEPKRKDVIFVKGDMLKIDNCKNAFNGVDTIIHLAAIPHLFSDPPEKVFYINTIGTFSVFQAAADLGIKRVIYGSSDSAYGFNWRNSFDDIPIPIYLPVDENHPQEPKDAYGLSKKVGEEIAKTFNRKYGMTTISLRISHVRVPEENNEVGIEAYKKDIKGHGRMLPPRVYNKEGNITQIFCYNDVRDAARAFRLAVEAKGLEGRYEAFNICADDNISKFNLMEFIKMLGWSEVPLKKEIKDRQSFFDWSKAKRLLGFQPLHNWYDLYIK